MKLISIALLLTTACGAAGPQTAELGRGDTERVHEGGRVKLWIPSGWAVDDSGGPDALTMTAPDQTVSLEVTMVEGKDLGTALLAVGAAALIGYDNLELVGSPVSADIHGMPALFQDGRGSYHGTSVELSVGVIDTPADKFLVVVGEAESATYAEHEDTIRHVMQGIKPL